MPIAITDGPSKFNLMIQLFHKPPRGHDHNPLAFTLEDGRVLAVFVQRVAKEDGSYESFMLGGYIMNGAERFSAHYCTDTRKGTLVDT